MATSVVIVGGGHAGGQASAALRSEGFSGRIMMVADEPHLPYQRPPLSKGFLSGALGMERIYLKPEAFYQQQHIELLLGRHAEALDRDQRKVYLNDGRVLDYDNLLLATGSGVRHLGVPGTDLSGVYYLRTIGDSEAIRAHLKSGAAMVVVGGGYIGLEVASVAATHGLRVIVLEMAPHVMARVVDPAVAAVLAQAHRSHGVEICTGTTVVGFEGAGHVTSVRCADGASYPADLVVIGVGIAPDTKLAAAAGLRCENGIWVDEYARTSDPAIYACGDCTYHPNSLLGCRLRLESVHNAVAQARVAAANLCGKQTPYSEIPWFWSDQYDIKLQLAGIFAQHDELVLRGDPQSGRFSAFYLKQGIPVAVNTFNDPQEFMAARTLLARRLQIDPKQLADPRKALSQST
ncbi:MAG: NAD(P)/FAD-dependent oxidoreductase [Gammaproteobacteria bacterium]